MAFRRFCPRSSGSVPNVGDRTLSEGGSVLSPSPLPPLGGGDRTRTHRLPWGYNPNREVLSPKY